MSDVCSKCDWMTNHSYLVKPMIILDRLTISSCRCCSYYGRSERTEIKCRHLFKHEKKAGGISIGWTPQGTYLQQLVWIWSSAALVPQSVRGPSSVYLRTAVRTSSCVCASERAKGKCNRNRKRRTTETLLYLRCNELPTPNFNLTMHVPDFSFYFSSLHSCSLIWSSFLLLLISRQIESGTPFSIGRYCSCAPSGIYCLQNIETTSIWAAKVIQCRANDEEENSNGLRYACIWYAFFYGLSVQSKVLVTLSCTWCITCRYLICWLLELKRYKQIDLETDTRLHLLLDSNTLEESISSA
ncbi:hypothetical protein V8C26DRAFT_166324 [Trichoderma gracile]